MSTAFERYSKNQTIAILLKEIEELKGQLINSAERERQLNLALAQRDSEYGPAIAMPYSIVSSEELRQLENSIARVNERVNFLEDRLFQ